jgi:hypothetical protein
MLLYTDMEGSAKLSGKEGRKARTELINALGVSKFVATRIVLAEVARTEIPSFDLSLLKRTSGHGIGLPTKTAANDSCLFEPGVSCYCDLSALQGSGVPWQPSEAIADRDDPPR